MEKSFDKMIKSELEEAAKLFKLTAKVIEKSVEEGHDKPTNADYVAVLEGYKKSQDSANSEVANEVKAAPKLSKVKKDAKLSKQASEAVMAEDLLTLVPVIVTDHDNNVTIEEDSENRLFPISFGNPTIGMTTVNVARHGQVQYLPKGAVLRLKKISLAYTGADADGKTIAHRDGKRFSISDVTPWTKEEFDARKEEQKLKKLR